MFLSVTLFFEGGCEGRSCAAKPTAAAHNFVSLRTGSTLCVMIGRYFFREPIRERLFDGDAFAYRYIWRTSTRTDSWHSDSPRRLSCLTTETGTMAFLTVASGGTSFSVHRQCGGHSCLGSESVHSSHLQRTTREHFDPNVFGVDRGIGSAN